MNEGRADGADERVEGEPDGANKKSTSPVWPCSPRKSV